jgi:hypothetical protein
MTMWTVILAIHLGLMFLIVGLIKLGKSRDAVVASAGGGWAAGYSARAIKVIGLTESVAGILLITGSLSGRTELTLAALSVIVILMVGAAWTHVKRAEVPQVALTLVLAFTAIAVGALSLA